MNVSHFKKTTLASLIGAAAMLSATGNANAHAFSIGYENAGANAATVWLGTYNHGVMTNEGSLNLVGVNGNTFASTTVAYNLLVSSKPAGLIDGTTNFFVSTPLNVSGPLVGSDTIWLTSLCSACGPANHWQGATFTGLSAGDYKFTYVPRANPTAEWTPYNDSLNGIFTISGTVLNPVPEPETYALMLAGLGVVGYMARRRKQERAAA
jgi:hypothetical protein